RVLEDFTSEPPPGSGLPRLAEDCLPATRQIILRWIAGVKGYPTLSSKRILGGPHLKEGSGDEGGSQWPSVLPGSSHMRRRSRRRCARRWSATSGLSCSDRRVRKRSITTPGRYAPRLTTGRPGACWSCPSLRWPWHRLRLERRWRVCDRWSIG